MRYWYWSLKYITAYARDCQLRRAFLSNLKLWCGFCCTAHHLFDKSPQRGVPATHDNVHEILASFLKRNKFGMKPTKFELCTALNCCAKRLDLHLGLQIHAQILQIGYQDNLFINSSLVNVYAKGGELVYAMRVFDEMEFHDQVSWTSIISGFSQNGYGGKALSLFKKMLRTLVRPNCFTYVSVISGCSEQESVFKCGESLHAHVIILGHELNNFVISSLIDYYSKCGGMDQASMLFEASTTRDDILVNSMISGYSRNLLGEEALKLFVKMHRQNMGLSEHALTSILDACGALTVLLQGTQVHSLVTKMGSNHNAFVVGALINMYAKCGHIDEARRVFDQTLHKNNILWTSMITGYAQNGKGLDALEFFDNLVKKTRFTPDHICLTAVLTACNHSGLLDKGISYFKKMISDYDLAPEIDQYACLIDLYARKGDLLMAKKIMEEMPFNANSVMWSSFLSSCKEYGNVELGREAAYKLFELEPHSVVSYLLLADIYAGAGLWNKVFQIKKLMNENGVRKSTVGWSWVEVEKEVHVFSVGDISHTRSKEIYLELGKINLEMSNECLCSPLLVC